MKINLKENELAKRLINAVIDETNNQIQEERDVTLTIDGKEIDFLWFIQRARRIVDDYNWEKSRVIYHITDEEALLEMFQNKS